MKRIIALFMAIQMLLTGCSQPGASNSPQQDETPNNSLTDSSNVSENKGSDEPTFAADVQPNFASLNDPALLQYVEDNLYSDLVARFDSEDYIVEDISAVYVSEEYLEEVAYNSKKNIYFGYTLEELDAQFQGTRYIFSLGENGETVVEEFAA